MWNWYKSLKRPAIPAKHALVQLNSILLLDTHVGLSRKLVVHSLIYFATLMPLGYGAVQVWRYGGGLDYNDTCVAMASYTVVYGLSMGFLPLMKKRCLAGCVLNMGALFGNSILMYQLFRAIYRPAANLVLPYSVATAYYALMLLSMWRDCSGKVCRICYSNKNQSWVHPCRCSGTIQWVHQLCLQTWIMNRPLIDRYVCPICSYKFRTGLALKPFSRWAWQMLDPDTVASMWHILWDSFNLFVTVHVLCQVFMEANRKNVICMLIYLSQIIACEFDLKWRFYSSLWTRFFASFYELSYLDYQE